ncbi:transcriptional regulator with XRE-family HTH domain [Dyadobacter sp. BE34]|uniref:Transcriptional regulator with XRE-family HTH domain n=1 Tax=Dyadobacter fermentans TaxID=94254 RepID=A0ABU1R4L2_9BACT|nr:MULTISPECIES: helix-turn-helix transcriptional regulator [Dyadobacter]MDR6807520.1 transcriptional regulator with XRE-family HTH domain [Dyadobacter fermentans]MDR7045261.1 transcriptional regulator with XRE-family HTH domain [Dyadobacter sp. BE242]MDR7199574.1 transcriptional regulator with XRE-family HTH domain [Dyadobacter sp. BE34]MDR7217967.1 transcriptional regulator with XRE-family HTH domain [Dyadobacter sp. BE31]MDR7265465.1 transcriptional regulator with XRE-family HTH domain [Dya
MSTATKTSHIGHKISRIRELRGLKQEFVAHELRVSQQTVSKIEQSETIDAELLEQISKILGVPAEGIKNFNEEAVFNYIQNNYEGASGNYSGLYNCQFNPLDKLIEAFEDNKKLYERLLLSEREKIELLKDTKG